MRSVTRHRIRILFLLLVLIGSTGSAWAWPGRVLEIASSQVLVIKTEQEVKRVSLFGVDSVPKGHPHQAQVQRCIKNELAPLNRVEVVPVQGHQAHVYIEGDGQNLAEELIRAGYAWVDRADCGTRICRFWRSLEAQARQEHRGLWAEPSFPVGK